MGPIFDLHGRRGNFHPPLSEELVSKVYKDIYPATPVKNYPFCIALRSGQFVPYRGTVKQRHYRILITDEDDLGITKEAFNEMVDNLVQAFSLLRWKWLGAEGEMQCSAVQCVI